MTTNDINAQKKLRDHHIEALKRLLQRIPRLRLAALNEARHLILAALHAATAQKANGNSTIDDQFVGHVQALEPHWKKGSRPELVEPKLPAPPIDELTKQPILEMPTNKTEQVLLKNNYLDWFQV